MARGDLIATLLSDLVVRADPIIDAESSVKCSLRWHSAPTTPCYAHMFLKWYVYNDVARCLRKDFVQILQENIFVIEGLKTDLGTLCRLDYFEVYPLNLATMR